jgi:hypothetical protein
MSDEIFGAVSTQRLLGHELARAAEALVLQTGLDPLDRTDTLRLATVQVLLAMYWELRHQCADEPAPYLEWISALLCSVPEAVGGRPAS